MTKQVVFRIGHERYGVGLEEFSEVVQFFQAIQQLRWSHEGYVPNGRTLADVINAIELEKVLPEESAVDEEVPLVADAPFRTSDEAEVPF